MLPVAVPERQLSGGEYMELKAAKQQAHAHAKAQESDLFRGMVFYVNGATSPTMDELHEMIHRNGGGTRHQHTKDVTHAITNQLSRTKLTELKPTDRALRPEWIVDSLARGRLQAYSKYDIRNAAAAVEAVPRVPRAADSSDAPTCKDGERFLQAYMRESRLHHLSTWKADFQEQLCDELMENGPHQHRATFGDAERIIFHVDMDCFFAAVVVRDNPHLRGKPLAITHSDEKGEISACSYEAKAFGVRAGMLVEQARERCPELMTARYAFDKYEQTSRTLFRLLMGFTHRLEIVSCDEAFLDLTDAPLEPGEDARLLDDMDVLSGGGGGGGGGAAAADEAPLPSARVRRAHLLATRIRAAIEQATGCKASIGGSDNMLLARMATEDAKPDGQHLVFDHNRLEFLATRKVDDLPGVGHSTKRKFAEHGIHSCSDLLSKPEEWLRTRFGPKNGTKLFQYAQGHCDKEVTVQGHRKSISLEVNSGIRFHDTGEVNDFIDVLGAELWRRLKGRRGRRLAVRVMTKLPGWIEPTWKWLGHGHAESKQKTRTFANWVADEAQLRREAQLLYRECGPRDATDLVGIGLAMEKLDESDAVRRAQLQLAMDSASLSQPTLSQMVSAPPVRPAQLERPAAAPRHAGLRSGGARGASNKYVKLTLADVDESTLNDLPPSVRREILDELTRQKHPPPPPPPPSRGQKRPPPPKPQPKRPPAAPAHEPKERAPKAARVEPEPEAWEQLPESVRLDVQRGVATGDVELAKQAAPSAAPAPLQQAHLTKRGPSTFAAPAPKRADKPSAYVRLQRDDIDEAVLSELPPEERERILAELQGEEDAQGAKRKAAMEAQPAALEAAAPAANDDGDGGGDDGDGALLFARGRRYAHWRGTAMAHLRAIDVELADGMVALLSELLWQHARQSIEREHNLEDAYLLLRDVRRHCERSGSSKWAAVFDAVLALTQELVAQRYNGDLLDLRPLSQPP